MSFKRSLRFAQHFIECAECGENAEYHCRNCFKNLCQACRSIHTENVATRFHTVTLYTEKYEESLETISFCSIHKDHPNDKVCQECDRPVCSKCMIETHRGHIFKKHYISRYLQSCFNFRVPYLGNFLQHISVRLANKIWVADGEGIVCMDTNGRTIDEVEGTFSDWGCHTVDSSGNLLYVDVSENSIIRYDPAKETRIKTLITSLSSAPTCIFSCPRTKNIIVALKEGEKDVIIRYDKEGKELCRMSKDSGFDSYIRYLTENVNGDICLSCCGKLYGSVVAMKTDVVCFSYSGRMGGPGFMPLGICTDSNGWILVINATERNIHVIGQDGLFLSVLYTGERGSYYNCGLCIDVDGYLWTCGERGVAKWEYNEKTDKKKKCSVS